MSGEEVAFECSKSAQCHLKLNHAWLHFLRRFWEVRSLPFDLTSGSQRTEIGASTTSLGHRVDEGGQSTFRGCEELADTLARDKVSSRRPLERCVTEKLPRAARRAAETNVLEEFLLESNEDEAVVFNRPTTTSQESLLQSQLGHALGSLAVRAPDNLEPTEKMIARLLEGGAKPWDSVAMKSTGVLLVKEYSAFHLACFKGILPAVKLFSARARLS